MCDKSEGAAGTIREDRRFAFLLEGRTKADFSAVRTGYD